MGDSVKSNKVSTYIEINKLFILISKTKVSKSEFSFFKEDRIRSEFNLLARCKYHVFNGTSLIKLVYTI